jgi:hypothetical protein
VAKRRLPLLLDTNLCVLLAVGAADPGYIPRHKRLSAYGVEDFGIVSRLVSQAPRLLFCPNVLTEVSNLIRLSTEPVRRHVAQTLANIVNRSDEQCIGSRDAMGDPRYLELGLTDAVLLMLARQGARLLTADLGLHQAALKARLDTTNYNHIRDQLRGYRSDH